MAAEYHMLTKGCPDRGVPPFYFIAVKLALASRVGTLSTAEQFRSLVRLMRSLRQLTLSGEAGEGIDLPAALRNFASSRRLRVLSRLSGMRRE